MLNKRLCSTREIITTFAAILVMSTASFAAEEVEPYYQRNNHTLAPDVHWVGVAASPNGRIFKSEDNATEAAAKTDALNTCEHDTARTCRVFAVPEDWDVVVLMCTSGKLTDVFLGGSYSGSQDYIANNKALAGGYDTDDCRAIYRF